VKRAALKPKRDKLLRIEQSDMSCSDSLVVAETLKVWGCLVVGREDLHDNPRDRGYDVSSGKRHGTQHDVRDAIPRALDDLTETTGAMAMLFYLNVIVDSPENL
jgi:hypothetical protein